MAQQSIYYVVPNMKLIPQDKSMACWYASAQMLVQWRRNQTQSTVGVDPSESAPTKALYAQDGGISDARIVQLAMDLGLRAVPPMTPTPLAISQWLHRHGPLWVNGILHITVIAGINMSESGFSLLVYDPGPVDKGTIEWRDAVKWYTGKTWTGPDGTKADSGRDTKTNAGVFLYMPDG